MTLEIPVLRLGLAGFSAEQAEVARQAALRAAPTAATAQWVVGPFAEADAWWVCGSRTTAMPDGTLRIAPGTPSARAVQLDVAEVDRPLAFSKPLPGAGFEAAYAFHLDNHSDTQSLLDKFAAWLRPVVAQFSLASCIIDHAGALGGGTFEVMQGTILIAVVDMRGEVGVLATAGPTDFEEAMWRRVADGTARIPEGFARVSMSQLMWNFAMRTRRDLLPAHYRTGILYFRRPPRLPQNWLQDSHLLLLRELASGCGTLIELTQRTGLSQAHVARDLAALYLVGAITSNPKRAAAGATRRLEVPDSVLSGPPSIAHSSILESGPGQGPGQGPGEGRGRVPISDMTAPAPLRGS